MLKLSILVAAPVLASYALSGGMPAADRSTNVAYSKIVDHLPLPLDLRPLAPGTALQVNAHIPFSNRPIVAAAPFRFKGKSDSRERALECLTAAVYYEAASQDRAGQQAVAQVVLNRVRHPAFPQSVCGVVFQGSTRSTGCQFSFTCDGSLMRNPQSAAWSRAREVAEEALSGTVDGAVGLSTHYHANYVVPYWATSLAKNVQVGAHIFYSWPDAWGAPAAFSRRPATVESDPVVLTGAALMAHDLWRVPVPAARSRLTFHSDPAIELAGVIDVLTRPASPKDTAYEGEIRGYFASVAGHPAVELMRHSRGAAEVPTVASQTASLLHAASMPVSDDPATAAAQAEPAATPSLPEAIRDFAEKSDFASFLRSHRGTYAAAARNVASTAAQAASDWQAYSGIPLQNAKVTLTLTAQGDLGASLPADRAAHALFWSDRGRVAEADLITRFGLSQNDLLKRARASSANGPRPDAALLNNAADDIVTAVFLRVAALSHRDAGALVSSGKCGGVTPRAQRFAARLNFYEHHRDQFATLADFLPLLLSGETTEPAAACGAPAQVQ
ncbi:cell wall hydrolase [Sphingomonas sp. F9_3S_D5_B_2]